MFKQFQDEIRDWLVYIEINSEPCLIGQFPKSLFTSLGDKADNIRLGGFVVTRTTKMALMGSGFLTNNTKAASLSNIQLINKDGKASKVREDRSACLYKQQEYIFGFPTRIYIRFPRLVLRGNSP